MFISTENGARLNVAAIERIERQSGKPVAFTANSETAFALNETSLWEIVQIVPAEGEWFVLSPAGDEELHADRVIAWGMTIHGVVRPITARDPSGVSDEPWVLRYAGENEVVRDGSSWPSFSEWPGSSRY